jgi:hypothetical protein
MSRDQRRNIGNRKCSYEDPQQEMSARHDAGEKALKVYRKILPDILKDLSKIEDPRDLRKTKHSFTMLMLYGILMFVFQMESKRQANRKMSRILMENMKVYFPEIETLPHADTLSRLLEKIDPQEIEGVIVKLLKRLIANKKLDRYKENDRYIIAFDGTGKFTREWEWSRSCLKRHVKGMPEDVYKYYTYVLEASIVLPNGIAIPFMSEFLDRDEFSIECENEETLKQDCELKAFKRLAERVKRVFPRLGITVTLDGLYANGPIMELLKKYNWDFMITLKNDSLKSIWEDFEGLKRRNRIELHKGKMINDVKQDFFWANDIEYRYENNGRKAVPVNIVICQETVYTKDKDTGRLKPEEQKKYAWISSKRLTVRNVSKRCNALGRPRWNIETQNLIEKHHGYGYKHCFSYEWRAMKAFHYLMHIGHIINILTLHFKELRQFVKGKGARGTIEYLYKVFSGCMLDHEKLKGKVEVRYQYRFEI